MCDNSDCQMVKDLVNHLWRKGIISDQAYENLFYCEYARDLKDIKNFRYAQEIKKCREGFKKED